MAGGTVITDPRVVEYRWQKRSGGMAEVTILRSGQMVGGRILTGRKLPVMTAVAAIVHTRVIEHTGGKTAGDMTHGTIFRRRYVIRRLANRGRAVMTRGAVIHDTRVIKHRC